MTTLPIINQGKSYYGGSSQVSDIQDEIVNIQDEIVNIQTQLQIIDSSINDILDRFTMNVGQIYKSAVSFAPVNVLTGQWITLTATDTVGTMPGDFDNPSPGVLKYTGLEGYFNVNYTFSGVLAATDASVTFGLYVDEDLIESSVSIISMLGTEVVFYYNATGGSVINLLTNDSITVRARTQGANDILDVQNLTITATRILQ